MTTPPPVLLVLAWDDDDPSVHRVAATGALPALPTLPLVRALADGQPVLALLPQLPAAPANGQAGNEAGTVVGLGPASRLVGLGDFTPAALALGLGHPATGFPKDNAPAGAVQLRRSLAQRAASGWQAPAAPYTGRAESPANGPAAAPGSAPTADPGALAGPTATPNSSAAPGPAPLPAAPPAPGPTPLFEQPEDEIGAAEAADLAADDHDVAPQLPAPAGPTHASLAQGLAALHRPPAATAAAAVAPAFDLSDDLHYRVIQYARFATYLSDTDAEDFGAIYAPDWPTWLAALEIRYRRRRPLVLHLSLVAAESAAPAERGWLLELERYALRRAHTVLVVSDELRAQVLKHYNLAPDRVRVVAADNAEGVRAVLAEVGRAT